MKRKIVLLMSFFLLTAIAAIAGTAGNITGKLIDNQTKKAVDFANVAVFNPTGNKLIKGAVTGNDGGFNLQGLPFGKYMLKVSFVGYSPLELPIVLDPKHPDLNVGSIQLAELTRNLKEVNVTGQKSQMRFEIDRKVFNVDQNIAAAGASATEILKNIPSVEVDVEGNISLRNNSNVIIWINGRPSGLNEDNRAQILEQMPAESIERIEVITNPSAKYSPEGSAGIINIVLKKDRKGGYYGSASVGGDTFKGINSSFNINYNSPKWDAYANIGYRKNEFKMKSDGDRTSWNPLTNDTTQLLTKNRSTMGGSGIFSRAGITYHATDKDHIGLSGMFMTSDRNSESDVNYIQRNILGETLSNRFTKSDGNHGMYSATLDYTHEFAKKGHEIKSSVEFNSMNFDNNSIINQSNSTQKQLGTNDRKEIEVQIDYTYPINEASKIEAGYKGEFNDRKSNTDASILLPLASAYIDQPTLDNIFNSTDNRNSLYLTYSGKKNKLSYQIGLRGEYNEMKNTSINYDKDAKSTTTLFNNTYPGIYPSFFFNYSLPKGNELQLNYTRRINRPNGRMMNPYRNVSDSLNINFGNPDLTPEYSNSLELNHIKSWDNSSLSSSVYYRTTSDVIQSVSYVEDNIKYSTSQNITNSQAAGFEFIMKNRLIKVLDLTSTLNLFYNQLDGFEYGGNKYDGTESFAWNARIMANMGLPGGFMGQITGGYQSKRNVAQGEVRPSWGLDAGLRKTFFNRKFSINLMARDILNSRKNRGSSWGTNFRDYTESQFGGRMFGINLTYNFGSQSLQKKKLEKGKENGDTEIMNGNDF